MLDLLLPWWPAVGGGSSAAVAAPTVARNVTVTFRVANAAVPTFRNALDVPVTLSTD